MDMEKIPTNIENSRFLRACSLQWVDTTPVWLMRQAGHYMAEYQQLRRKYSFWDIISTPSLACMVTLQPVHAYNVDAAIMFADTLPMLQGMGVDLEFVNDEGLMPIILNPIRGAADVARLYISDPEEALPFTFETIKMVRRELEGKNIPLLGFSGAPFTLASRMIENGRGQGSYLRTKRFLQEEPDAWHQLMTKLSHMIAAYLLAQIHAGAQALCLFDSRVGVLSMLDYQIYVLPYIQHVVSVVHQKDIPIIYIGANTSGMLELMSLTGCNVIGIDWRLNIDIARQRIGGNMALQGNLDPTALFAPWIELKVRIQNILDQAAGCSGHIFNLGAPIVGNPPVDNVRRLIDFVHEYTSTRSLYSSTTAQCIEG